MEVPTNAPIVVAVESAKTALPIPSTFPSWSTLPVKLATEVRVPAVSKKSTKRNLIIGVESDILFPIDQQEELANGFSKAKKIINLKD